MNGGKQKRAVATDFLNDAGSGPRCKHHDPCIVGHLHGCGIGARTKGIQDGKGVVTLDELLYSTNRLLWLAGVVFNNQSYFATMYTTCSAPLFSSIAVAVPPDVIVGATSSRSLIASVTSCSLALPALSVATTVKA